MKMRFSLCSSILVIAFIGFQHVLAQDNSVACETSRGEKGNCINIRQCPPLLQVLKTQGRAAGDYLRSTLCGYDGRDPRVCCPDQGRNNNNGDSDDSNVEDRISSKYGPLKPPHCGYSNDTHSRVVGGIPARLGAWPWIVSLGYLNKMNPRSPKFLCGGTLISSRHVLTAAHCVYRRNDIYMVRIADLDLKSDNDGAKPINVGIERITIHPNYSPTLFTNDIAMLRLRSEVPFSELLHPICLPVTREVRSVDLDNALPFIAGFGAIGYGEPASSRLLEAQVPVVKNDQCRQSYARVSNTIIDDRVLCAGYARGGKDACQGDSGGPLMFPADETYYLIGVVSYGYRCAEPGFPGVYTKVSAFMDFILKHLV